VTNPAFDQLLRYNGLDCCGTQAILEILESQLTPVTRATYEQSLRLYAPAMKMMVRGVKVNKIAIGQLKHNLLAELRGLQDKWAYLTRELTGQEVNPGSPKQLKDFFYGTLNLPPQHKFTKGVKSITTDREAMEKLIKLDLPAVSIVCNLLLAQRDIKKTLDVVTTGLEPSGRIRSSFNPCGTDTGRWSSSTNVYHRGTNLQNITEDLRHIFISDVGYKFFNIDYEQVDSRNVALEVYLTTGDSSYLEACESGDLHTQVAKMTWPDLGWTGDPKADKALAETPYYRHYSYRFMCKKLGHGSNYLGKPKTLAKQSRIELHIVEAFQEAYFSAFPGIPLWHQIRIEELQLKKGLTTILGRYREFHDRLSDEATWRKAIAFLGQSPTADLINKAMLRIDDELPEVQLLIQVHDSLLGQYPEEQEDELFPKVLSCFANPITVTHPTSGPRTHLIPSDGTVGWNWGKRWKEGPNGTVLEIQKDGLDKWRGHDDRQRHYNPGLSILDRRLS